MCSKTLIPNCKTLFGFKQALCQMNSSCDFALPGRAELLLVVREAGRPRGVLAMASGERTVEWEQGSIWRPFSKGWVLSGLLHLICLETWVTFSERQPGSAGDMHTAGKLICPRESGSPCCSMAEDRPEQSLCAGSSAILSLPRLRGCTIAQRQEACSELVPHISAKWGIESQGAAS